MNAPHRVTLENERAPHGRIRARCAECPWRGEWRRMRTTAEGDAQAHQDSATMSPADARRALEAGHTLVDCNMPDGHAGGCGIIFGTMRIAMRDGSTREVQGHRVRIVDPQAPWRYLPC